MSEEKKKAEKLKIWTGTITKPADGPVEMDLPEEFVNTLLELPGDHIVVVADKTDPTLFHMIKLDALNLPVAKETNIES